MGKLFQKEEAILLGYMLSKFFAAPYVYGYQGSFGNHWGFLIGGGTSDGSGGFPEGHNGKPAIPNGVELCGVGGGQTAGGDGGSSFVYGIDSASDWYMQIQDYMKEQGFSDFQPSDVLAIHNPLLPELNPYFEYNTNFGHGRVIINGVIFDYTGTVQTYTVEEDGTYKIECWGAQGGSISTSTDTTRNDVGGAGGYARAFFPFKKGMVLYVYVGEYGGNIKAPIRPFGGGGCGSISRDGLNYPTTRPDVVNPETGTNPAQNITPKTEKENFIISDLSIATVDITYTTTEDIKEEDYIRVNLYVDGVHRGTLEKEVKAGGGSDSWVFDNFDTWLEEGTVPYWATIQATVDTSLKGLVIPPRGLIIRVSTKTRPNDVKPKITKLYKENYSYY